MPDRVLRAMDRPVPDHRGEHLPALVHEVVAGLKELFGTTRGEIVLYPGSGTAAWEASLVNTLSPGDRVLAFDNGHFSHLFAECARRLGMSVDEVPLAWTGGVPPALVAERLANGEGPPYRAVLVVHNETSTGVTSDMEAIGRAVRESGRDALLLVDTVSSLGATDFRFDEWGIDVALTGSQKGLMLPPGLGILCVGERAREAERGARSARFFLDWAPVLEQMESGYFPYTPATLMLYGLREALCMLREEGIPRVLTRHARLAAGVRAAVGAWGLETQCRDPLRHSSSLTGVVVPGPVDATRVLEAAERHLHLSLGAGLGRLRGRMFRIGHLGSLNELEVLATLGGTELAMRMAGVSFPLGAGLLACQQLFAAALPQPGDVAGAQRQAEA